MRYRHAMFLIAALLVLPVASTVARAAGDPAKGQVSAQMCAACHGADGNSVVPMNPTLAGQHADYIFNQLKAFKSGARANLIMAPMAANLTDDDMRDIAAYYASQRPRGGAAKDAASVEMGRKLFRGGNMAQKTAACAGCHSPNGAGIPAQYPRLAGQHAEYTVTQLKAFRGGTRTNDPNGMMRAIAGKLSDAEMDFVAQFIAGLK